MYVYDIRHMTYDISLPHLFSEEDFEVVAAGQDGVLGDPVKEAVQRFPPGLYEVVIEALHHALHHKLLWERLQTHQHRNLNLTLETNVMRMMRMKHLWAAANVT